MLKYGHTGTFLKIRTVSITYKYFVKCKHICVLMCGLPTHVDLFHIMQLPHLKGLC